MAVSDRCLRGACPCWKKQNPGEVGVGFVPPVTWPGMEPWRGRFVFVFLLDTCINFCRGHNSCTQEQSREVTHVPLHFQFVCFQYPHNSSRGHNSWTEEQSIEVTHVPLHFQFVYIFNREA